MRERLLREALLDPALAWEAMREARRSGDLEAFTRIFKAHATPRDQRKTWWTMEASPDVTLWVEMLPHITLSWASVEHGLNQAGFHYGYRRHRAYANALPSLRYARHTREGEEWCDVDRAMKGFFNKVFDATLLELQKQQAQVQCIEVHKPIQQWLDEEASEHEWRAFHDAANSAAYDLGTPDFCVMTPKTAQAWIQWLQKDGMRFVALSRYNRARGAFSRVEREALIRLRRGEER
jgi:hypothetical protein